ncbi:DUF4123 domain-containing protein [Pokkaliibacter plantistimulans]|nr:DUF4123 domain-containing protein [Pokkaliibacter plantistimulans]
MTQPLMRAGFAFGHAEHRLPLDNQTPLALVIDSARLPQWLHTAAMKEPELQWASLYEGTAAERFEPIGPFLLRTYAGSPVLSLLATDPAWGTSAMLISHQCDFDTLLGHLRSLVFVEDGNRLNLMRFYSPWILDTWFAALADERIHALLGPAEMWAWRSFNYHDDGEWQWSWVTHAPGKVQHQQGWYRLSADELSVLDKLDEGA